MWKTTVILLFFITNNCGKVLPTAADNKFKNIVINPDLNTGTSGRASNCLPRVTTIDFFGKKLWIQVRPTSRKPIPHHGNNLFHPDIPGLPCEYYGDVIGDPDTTVFGQFYNDKFYGVVYHNNKFYSIDADKLNQSHEKQQHVYAVLSQLGLVSDMDNEHLQKQDLRFTRSSYANGTTFIYLPIKTAVFNRTTIYDWFKHTNVMQNTNVVLSKLKSTSAMPQVRGVFHWFRPTSVMHRPSSVFDLSKPTNVIQKPKVVFLQQKSSYATSQPNRVLDWPKPTSVSHQLSTIFDLSKLIHVTQNPGTAVDLPKPSHAMQNTNVACAKFAKLKTTSVMPQPGGVFHLFKPTNVMHHPSSVFHLSKLADVMQKPNVVFIQQKSTDVMHQPSGVFDWPKPTSVTHQPSTVFDLPKPIHVMQKPGTVFDFPKPNHSMQNTNVVFNKLKSTSAMSQPGGVFHLFKPTNAMHHPSSVFYLSKLADVMQNPNIVFLQQKSTDVTCQPTGVYDFSKPISVSHQPNAVFEFPKPPHVMQKPKVVFVQLKSTDVRHHPSVVIHWSKPTKVVSQPSAIYEWSEPTSVTHRPGVIFKWSKPTIVTLQPSVSYEWSDPTSVTHRPGVIFKWSNPTSVTHQPSVIYEWSEPTSVTHRPGVIFKWPKPTSVTHQPSVIYEWSEPTSVTHRPGVIFKWSKPTSVTHQPSVIYEWSEPTSVTHRPGVIYEWSEPTSVPHRPGVIFKWSKLTSVTHQPSVIYEWSEPTSVTHRPGVIYEWSEPTSVPHRPGVIFKWSKLTSVTHQPSVIFKWSEPTSVTHRPSVVVDWTYPISVTHQPSVSYGWSKLTTHYQTNVIYTLTSDDVDLETMVSKRSHHITSSTQEERGETSTDNANEITTPHLSDKEVESTVFDFTTLKPHSNTIPDKGNGINVYECSLTLITDHTCYFGVGKGNANISQGYFTDLVRQANQIFQDIEFTMEEHSSLISFTINSVVFQQDTTAAGYPELLRAKITNRNAVFDVMVRQWAHLAGSSCYGLFITCRDFENPVRRRRSPETANSSVVHGEGPSGAICNNQKGNLGLVNLRCMGMDFSRAMSVLVVVRALGRAFGAKFETESNPCIMDKDVTGEDEDAKSFVMSTPFLDQPKDVNLHFSPCSVKLIRGVAEKDGTCLKRVSVAAVADTVIDVQSGSQLLAGGVNIPTTLLAYCSLFQTWNFL